MKNLILLVSLFLLASSGYAQKQYLENNKTYSAVKIYQKGKSEIIRGLNLKILNDTLIQFEGQNTGTAKIQQYLISDVRYIAVKNGTYAGSYGAVGGGIGLLSAVYGVLSVKNDPTLDDSDVNWAPFIVGFTAGGAVLGALIGATKPRWKTLYTPDNKTSFNLQFYPEVTRNYYGFGIKVKF